MIDALKERIKNLASDYLEEIISFRRHLHANPELSTQEFETAEYISNFLKTLGIPHKTGVFNTGIIALIEGKNPSKKVIALRADMDALPIKEENEVEYKSKNEGVMHACGHDVHMSSMMGTVKILNELKEEFEGTVKVIFQPAEEKNPGGAKFMIEEGALNDPAPTIIFGQHVYPDIEAGKVGLRAGKYMASSDEINITVKGKGGHAAMPHLLVDPVVIAAEILTSLQQIVSRRAHFNMPTVLSFGRFVADGTYNVIPNEVELKGTFRTFDEKWRSEAHDLIKNKACSIAKAAGGDCEVFIDKGFPFLVNDVSVSGRAFKNAIEYLGEENVVELDLRTTAEDFAYFAQKVPACFYRLGIANFKKGINSNLHTPTFDVDEKSLETGMGTMAWLTLKELSNI